MAELQIEARLENLDEVTSFVDSQLEAADCSMKAQMQIDIAVEEIFVNIARYAYAPETGNAWIDVQFEEQERIFEIVFRDQGTPFDPTAKEDPDITLSAQERSVGGLGIFMVRKSMDELLYQRENGQNILTIRKKI